MDKNFEGQHFNLAVKRPHSRTAFGKGHVSNDFVLCDFNFIQQGLLGCGPTDETIALLNLFNQSQSQRSFIIFCKVEETKITIKYKYKGIQMGKNRRLSRAKSFYLKKTKR